MKKKNRRNSTKYPALKPEFNLKTRSDVLDYDYLDKLSQKELEWLNQFTEEYTNARFDKKKKTIMKEKLNPEPVKIEVIENGGPNHDITTVIKTKNTYKKQSYDKNNARNRCILTQQKAANRLVYLEKLKEKDVRTKSPEQQLIEKEELLLLKESSPRSKKHQNKS